MRVGAVAELALPQGDAPGHRALELDAGLLVDATSEQVEVVGGGRVLDRDAVLPRLEALHARARSGAERDRPPGADAGGELLDLRLRRRRRDRADREAALH